jgi:hypothetical protein
MPPDRIHPVGPRRNIPQISLFERTYIAFHIHADDVMEDPVFGPIKYLMVQAGWQIQGVPRLERKAGVTAEDLATTRDDIIHLLPMQVLVMVRRLAALDTMYRHNAKLLKHGCGCTLIVQRRDRIYRLQTRPDYRAVMADDRIRIAPVDYVRHEIPRS